MQRERPRILPHLHKLTPGRAVDRTLHSGMPPPQLPRQRLRLALQRHDAPPVGRRLQLHPTALSLALDILFLPLRLRWPPSPFGGNSLLAGVVKKLGGPAQTRRGGHCSISRHLRRRQTMTSSNKRPETALTAFLLKAPEQSLYALLGLEERDKNRSRALLGEALRRRAHRCRLIRRLENACLLLAVCRRTCVLERKRVLLERIQSASYLGNCLMRFGPRGAFIRRVASIRSLAVVSKRALSHRAFHARVEAARRVESAVDDLQAVTSKTADVSHSRSLTINPFQYALKCLPQAKTPQAPAAPAPDSDDDS